MRFRKHFFKNSSLAAHLGGGASSQGGGEQGTGARGSHYLDGSPRSHTIAAKGIVFEVRSGPKHWPFLIPSLNKNSLTDCPYFRSKRTATGVRALALVLAPALALRSLPPLSREPEQEHEYDQELRGAPPRYATLAF